MEARFSTGPVTHPPSVSRARGRECDGTVAFLDSGSSFSARRLEVPFRPPALPPPQIGRQIHSP